MSPTRRTFVAQASLAAAGLALPMAWRAPIRRRVVDALDLPTLMKLAGVPGVTHASVRSGGAPTITTTGVMDASSGAPVIASTLFEAASLSKPTVAYLALLLADRGMLDLDAPLRDVLGASPVPDDARGDRITLRHVLSHSSGLQNWRFAPEDTLALAFDPGTRFRYSGEGFVLVQRAMEKVTNTPFVQLMHRELFEPLGMRDSTFQWNAAIDARLAVPHSGRGDVQRSFHKQKGRALADWCAAQTPPRDAAALTYAELEGAERALNPGKPPFPNGMIPNAAASLLTTAGDYARFVSLLIDDTKAPSALRLRAATRQAMRTPRVELAPGLAWGLGIGLEERMGQQLLWHWGDNGGMKAFVVIDPAGDRGGVVFTNGSGGLKVAERLLRTDYGELASFVWV